jgi:alpha-L-arabinofuranosidase
MDCLPWCRYTRYSCFDEWNVWDPVRAPGELGAEEHYDLSDALAVAAWLNVFVRKADIVKIACIAQSINVISPIITSPKGLFRQTTFFPLHLFANLMQGTSLALHVESSSYTGDTVPKFIKKLHPDGLLTKYVDASGVLSSDGKEVRIALVNKHKRIPYDVKFRIDDVEEEMTVHEVWDEDIKTRNGFEEGEKITTKTRQEKWTGTFELKRHSFVVLVFKLKGSV